MGEGVAERKEFAERLLDLAAEVIRFTPSLNETQAGKHIAGQLMRAITSAGANWEETCGAESRSDYVHKMQIVLKELREALYWLKLIGRADLVRAENLRLESMRKETEELTKMVAKSVITVKAKS